MNTTHSTRTRAPLLLLPLCAAALTLHPGLRGQAHEDSGKPPAVPTLQDLKLLSKLFAPQGTPTIVEPESATQAVPGREVQVWELKRHRGHLPAAPEQGIEGLDGSWSTSLVPFLKAFASPPLEQGEDIQLLGGTHLVAVARPDVLHWIDRALAQRQQANSRPLLNVEMRLFRLPLAVVDDVRLILGHPVRDGSRIQSILVEPRRVQMLRERVLEADGVDQMMAPRLTTLEFDRAELMVADETSYVRDFEVTITRNAAIADPVVAVIRHGLSMSVIGAELEPGLLGVDLRLHQVELLGLEEFEFDLPGELGGNEVSVQLPRVRSLRLQQQVLLPPGASAVFAAPDENGYLLALITVTSAQRERPTGGPADPETPPQDGKRRAR